MSNRTALIPARGGSVGLRLKNLNLVGGHPLVAYVIRACIESEIFRDVVVSTDSALIAQVARKYGARAHNRDPHPALAQDEEPAEAVVENFLQGQTKRPDWVYWVQPTSPGIRPKDLRRLADLESQALRSVQAVSVVPHRFHEFNQRSRDRSGYLTFTHADERERARKRQDKVLRFAFAGVVGIKLSGKSEAIAEMFPTPSGAYILQDSCIVAVDSVEALMLYEALLLTGQVWDPFVGRETREV